MTNKFIGLLAAAASALMPSAAMADGLMLQEHPDHYKLWRELETAGIEMVINDPIMCGEEAQGLYGWNGDAGFAVLIVCQDNGRPGGLEVRWTRNDLDTLRHEAHHVVQDCLVGSFGDGKFSLLFDTPEKMSNFLDISGASWADVQKIFQTYSDTSKDVQWREVEAFWVARGVSADAIAEAVRNQCRN